MIRCMSSVGSGSETFGALKGTIYVKFFELSVHKMSNFLRILVDLRNNAAFSLEITCAVCNL